MTDGRAEATDDELTALRERGDLLPLIDALLDRGTRALDRGDWSAALRDLDEAALVARLSGQPGRAAQASTAAAVALRADGRLLAANAKMIRS